MGYVKRKYEGIYIDGYYEGYRIIGPNGSYVKTYDRSDRLHSFDGRPSVAYKNWKTCYHKHGKLHRLDGPAFHAGGKEKYYVNGKLHRDDGLPAYVCSYTSINGVYLEHQWYVKGKQYRPSGGPSAIMANGEMSWAHYTDENGLRHNEGGAAYIVRKLDETRSARWYKHGEYIPPEVVLTDLLSQGKAAWMDEERNVYVPLELVGKPQIIATP